MDQKTRCMQFLYKWVTKGHLSNLRKGMVEELEAFLADELSQAELRRSANLMDAQRMINTVPPNEQPVTTPEDPENA